MDPVAALTGFVGVASLVPAFIASRHEMPMYRPWYVRAFVMLLGGLASTSLSLFHWAASDVLFWLGVLLVATGALITWSLRFRTRRRLHPGDGTSQAG
jgi:multisubunit Na+/H+ antiporter MnhB subunit